MIKTIAKVVLPVDETLQIKRNRLEPSSCKNEIKRISIDTKSAGQIVLFVLRFCSGLGFVKYQETKKHESEVVVDTDMVSVQTAKSGIFESLVKTGDSAEGGTPLANIINTYDGEVMETLYAPIKSRVFFVHNEPLTYANTAVFKLVEF